MTDSGVPPLAPDDAAIEAARELEWERLRADMRASGLPDPGDGSAWGRKEKQGTRDRVIAMLTAAYSADRGLATLRARLTQTETLLATYTETAEEQRRELAASAAREARLLRRIARLRDAVMKLRFGNA